MTAEVIAQRQEEIAEELYEIHLRQAALWREQAWLLGQQKKQKPRSLRQIILGQDGEFGIQQMVAACPQFKSVDSTIYQLERLKLLKRVGHGRYIVNQENK